MISVYDMWQDGGDNVFDLNGIVEHCFSSAGED